ncbi:ABC transporter substrate-binding protein [Tessaracoccus sp. OS52]|uniref:ABC transporter substrate-binding protein n=1 Tax=Tessaracoccus sp. OS52 TaxID=2886691 RepID=UPI001D100F1D|nr:ABC transporter substrate-binding protein [Tessaracoccus sp. OS52]MCC2592181.1 ABC transporter substrate-binding protein [Tessaracoccus sp. OS52]
MRPRSLIAAAALAALALTACSTTTEEAGPQETTGSATDRSYDVSGVEKVDEIAALLPQDVADSGKLVIGAAIDYAPAEFRAEDLQTAIGYDVDLGKALGNVLGLESEVSAAEFASILPGIGTKYNVGISSFTITDERTENYNMISYITVGSSYAVKAGNPAGFDPDDVCGTAIGVQTGTWQEEELAAFSEECTAAGEEAIEVLTYPSQSDVTTNVVGGKADAMYADSTVSNYAVALTNEQLEVVGGVRDSAPQGIVVAQDDAELTEAMRAAMQHLMDDGTWEAILTSWGTEDAILTTAEVHP